MFISTLQIHSLIFLNKINSATCAACSQNRVCEVGLLYERGDIPPSLSKEQQDEVIRDFSTRYGHNPIPPLLWCLLADEHKELAPAVVFIREEDGKAIFGYAADLENSKPQPIHPHLDPETSMGETYAVDELPVGPLPTPPESDDVNFILLDEDGEEMKPKKPPTQFWVYSILKGGNSTSALTAEEREIATEAVRKAESIGRFSVFDKDAVLSSANNFLPENCGFTIHSVDLI